MASIENIPTKADVAAIIGKVWLIDCVLYLVTIFQQRQVPPVAT